mgnify:CR=1 FL=1
MIKLELPNNYQEKVEEVIKYDSDEDMTYSFGFIMRTINPILDRQGIASIHPGQILVHESFNKWLTGLPKDYDISQREWNLFLLNQGPCSDDRVSEQEIWLLNKEEYENSVESPEVSETVVVEIKTVEPKLFAQIVFIQGHEANKPISILNSYGEEKAIDYLRQWDYGEYHQVTENYLKEIGDNDEVYETDAHILTYNIRLNYIGLYKKLNQDEYLAIADKIK